MMAHQVYQVDANNSSKTSIVMTMEMAYDQYAIIFLLLLLLLFCLLSLSLSHSFCILFGCFTHKANHKNPYRIIKWHRKNRFVLDFDPFGSETYRLLNQHSIVEPL